MNKPYIRCKYYEQAKEEENKDKHFLVTERSNGEIEIKGCQDCNGYNTLCEVYREICKI